LFFNIIAQSAGVNVNATIPGSFATIKTPWTRHKGNWNKTAAIKNVIAIISNFMHRFLVALMGQMFFFHLSMDGFNNYNSIIDDDSIANTKANNVIKLSEISKNCMKIG
jgi:hypothetical protein